MNLGLQCFSLCWVRRVKQIVCFRTSRYRDVRWYAKSCRLEKQDLVKGVGPNREMQAVKIESRLNLVMKFFDVSKTTAHEIVQSDSCLEKVDIFNLSRNINTLKNNGVDTDDVRKNLQLLYYCPLTTEHRIAIFHELGLENVSAYQYRKFIKLFKSPVSLIKTYKLLPSDYDVHSVLPNMGVPKVYCERLKFPKQIDDLTLAEVHSILSYFYLCWCFQCYDDAIDYVYKSYPAARIKSIRLLSLLFKRLNENWNFSYEEILRHGYLFCGSPVNVELIEKHVKHLCSADPKVIAHFTPRIFNISFHQLCQLSDILVKRGVTQASVVNLPQVFTLRPSTVEKRIREFREIPEFSGIYSHPRSLRLIYYSTKVKSRLDLLRQIKDTRAMPSIHLLTGDQEKFNNYIARGYIRINMKDIVTLLSKQLGVCSSVIRNNLRLPFKRHQTSVGSVKNNLAYLMNKGFSNEQILNSLEVLLYPQDLVVEHLELLHGRLKSSSYEEIVNFSHSLQLLLYYLYKEVPY